VSIEYRIYKSDGLGGAVDYGTVIATVSALTWTCPPLAPSSDTTFAIRAYDTVSALSDRNTDARARVLIGPAGEDLTGLPNAPALPSARATAAGSAEVEWMYNAAGQGGAPTGFHVYSGTPAVSYTTPVATVLYGDDRMPYSATLTGLVHGSSYQVGVRAYNASGEESNAVVVSVTGAVTGPLPVVGLAGTAVSG
jgi:hypothetical protein